MTSRESTAAPATAVRFLARAAALAVASVAAYVVVGCARGTDNPANQTAIQSYVQGVRAYNDGDPDKAMASFQAALAKQSDLVMARSMLGDLLRARSDYEAAREQYAALVQLDPYYFFHHYRLGLSYQFLEQLNEAARSYARAIDLKPTDAPSNTSLGTVYFALAARDPDPNSAEALALRTKAATYAQRATELDPRSPAAFLNLGLILDANGDYAKAESAYRKSLDLDSSQTLVQLYLAENLIQQKKFGEARSVLSELVRVNDTPLHRKRMGDAFAGEKDFAGAISQYQTALKLDPQYYPALNEIGAAHIADYEKGLTLDDTKRKAALDSWQQSLSIKREQPRIVALVQKYAKAPMFQP
ncbi:MAG TPA: tetratricopeptide repeat protein [Tepidisphaeraceae bacterium]|nr:tetratricopeptide repeat protein [Tepidisphaeraceae bacterium]